MATAVAQILVQQMLGRHEGTIIFLGAGQLAANNDLLATTAVHAGIRALSQSLAREFHPKGVHISYLALNQWTTQQPEISRAIALTCKHVHAQPNSTWSQELSC